MPISAQPRTPAHDGLLDAAQVAFGGGQQILAFAGAFFGQERVAADDQALAGELLGSRDLGEIALIEERELQGAVRGGQRPDLRGTQAGDPVEPGRLEIIADAGAGDHAAIPDQHHPIQLKALLELADLRTERGRVGRIAVEHLNGDRQALARAQQAIDDLPPIGAMVTAVAKPRQRTFAALEIGGAHIVEHERAIPQVTACQAGLDPRLLCAEPVERRIDFTLDHLLQPQHGTQAGARRRGVNHAHEAELRARRDQAIDDEPNHQIAIAARLLVLGGAQDQPVERDLAHHAQRRRDMPVWQRALNPELVPPHHGAAGQKRLHPGNHLGGKSAQIGERSLLRLPLLVAVTLAQQHRRRRIAVGHGFDKHAPSHHTSPACETPYMNTFKEDAQLGDWNTDEISFTK
jgi:hypothetical protein